MKNDKETPPQEESKQTAIPKWLKNIQENSWELELLISGGAIFSLFKLSDPYIEWVTKIGTATGLPGLIFLALIGYFAIVVLTLGFCVHLCFRAYWLALVCINYAYPKGINSQKINFKKPFNTTTSEENTLKDLIIKIDRYAGLIMFASVLSIFILIGIVFLFGVYFMLFSWFERGIVITISETTLLFFILIYILDLLLLNSIRKIKYLSYILFPFFWLFDIISFRSLYKSAFLLFTTNVNKRRFVLVCIPFLIVSFVISYLSIQEIMRWPNLFDQRKYTFQMARNHEIRDNYYKDEQLPEKFYPFSISSKIQKEEYMEVFIAYKNYYDRLVERLPLPDSLKSMEQIIKIEIDSIQIENIDWFPIHRNNGYRGITSIIPTKQFKNGGHTLFVTIGEKIDKDKMIEFAVPFWIYRNEK
jgi:hypothetical protein